MESVVYVKDLVKRFKTKINSGKVLKDMFKPEYKEVEAVKSVSFEIKPGESVAFLGPNGAGKTTTIKMLTGLMYPTSGDISVMGYFPFDRKRDFLKKIGLVMGNKMGLNWDLTARQSFDLVKQIYDIPEEVFKKRVGELTEVLDIAHFLDIQVRRLSLGERMKMELIGAILHNPKILFLDEPTIGLDIISKQRIREFLREVQKRYKSTILLTSHDMGDVEKVSDRVIIINEGEIGYDDSMLNLTSKYKSTRYVKFVFAKKPEVDILPIDESISISEKGDNFYTFKIEQEDMADLISKISSNYNLLDIDIVPLPLEEIIADLFQT